jgi:serine/threonine protein phosphatase 1
MARVFIIGDIHGCCKTFKKLILEKINIQKSDKIYCLGDYVDRGPDSKGVIDFILQLRKKGFNIHTLRGNHEELLLNSKKDEKSFLHWTKNGGDKALESFKIDTIKKLKPVYQNFFKRTKFYIETKDFILVHAGLNFEAENPLLDKYALLWIRNFTVDNAYLKGKILIHGHSPKTRDVIISQNFESHLNLDGGCVFKDKEGYGSLFALNFHERKLIEVKNID